MQWTNGQFCILYFYTFADFNPSESKLKINYFLYKLNVLQADFCFPISFPALNHKIYGEKGARSMIVMVFSTVIKKPVENS
jgi:uncharacterized PurR-regulated membrane protein YhhQ (DUF165 family)